MAGELRTHELEVTPPAAATNKHRQTPMSSAKTASTAAARTPTSSDKAADNVTALSGTPFQRATQATFKIIGAVSFFVYLVGSDKFAYLIDLTSQRPWFVLDAPTCVLFYLLLTFFPRALGILRAQSSRARKLTETESVEENKSLSQYNACYYNSLEAFSYFGVAVVLAMITHIYSGHLDTAATLFLAFRTIYTAVCCFVKPQSQNPVRNIAWIFAFLVCLWLLITAGASYRAAAGKKM